MNVHKIFRIGCAAAPALLLILAAGCRSDEGTPQTAENQPPAAAQGSSQTAENQSPPAEVVKQEPARPKPPVSRPAPRPAPQPATTTPEPVTPTPQPVVKNLPAGTTMSLELLETLASNTNQTGDRFKARVAEDVMAGGSVAIPAGSEVTGVITEARSLKKIGGRAMLQLEFTSVEVASGRPSDLKASYTELGKSETKKDAATIGGAAVGGAILGRVLGHKKGNEAKGTAIGAAAGAAAGTAIAAATKGHEVVLPAGHVLHVTLDTSTQVTVRG